MKKTSFIFLTIVASLSVTLGSAQNAPPNNRPDYYLYELERKDSAQSDSIRRTRRDSLQNTNIYYPQPQIYYNYYYRNWFSNAVFRIFAPRRYYRLIQAPGFVPRHLRQRSRSEVAGRIPRPARGSQPAGSSTKRGGFGSSGRTQFN